VTTEALCKTCRWESAQPAELMRLDAEHHAKQKPSHIVVLITTTTERVEAL